MASTVKPLSPNASPEQQVAYWETRIKETGATGTEGRAALKSLNSAIALLDAEQAKSNPTAETSAGSAASLKAQESAATNQANIENALKESEAAVQNGGNAADKAASQDQTPKATSTATSSAPAFNPFTPVTTASQTAANNQPNGGFVGPQSDAEIQANWVNYYGPIASMALSTPWMKTILTNAINAKETPDKFVQSIQNYVDPTTQQKPWNSIAQSVKDSQEAFYGNQSAWVQQYNDKLQILQKSAVAQGLDPSYFGSPINPTDSAAAEKAFKDPSNPVNTYFNQYYNNTPDQGVIDQFVAQHATLMKSNNGGPQGAIATLATNLKNYAAQYGVNSMFANPSWTGASTSGQSTTINQGADYWTNAALAIQSGYTNADTLQANIRNTAANIYKPFATQIQNGYSLSDLAQPYMSAASNLLEVAPQSIDLGATSGVGYKLSQALQGDGTNPLSLDAFTKQVKQDPRWLQTANARNSMMDTADTLLRNFGLVTGQQ